MVKTRELNGLWTEDIRKAIDLTWREKCIPPSMRDIMSMTGVTSPFMVSYDIKRLAEAGYLDIVDGKAVPKWVIQKLRS